MRIVVTAFVCLAFVFSLSGQNNLLFNMKAPEKRGDSFFEAFSFQKALEAYEHAFEKHPDDDKLKLKIAECYRMLNKPHMSEEWYAQVIENEDIVNNEHKLHYAQTLSSNGKYDLSKEWYAKYGETNSDDSRTARKIESLENIHVLFRDSLVFTVDKLSINSPANDFSPSLYHNGVVFVSGRDQDDIAINNTFNWDHSNFLDLFYTEEREDGTNLEPVRFHGNVVKSFHEGPTTFYDDENKMIFTANNYDGNDLRRSKDGVALLKLYSAERNGSEWSGPVSLPFNDDHFSVGHPSMTHDEKVLYFSSNMPGGFGGTDLYKVSHENGNWGTPENLGELVNTEGNEMFPYVHHDGALYFASNGHGGLGGLDIYRLNAIGDLIDNMGHPFNSRWDDLGLILNYEGESGYFSSNREGGLGGDDMYYFELNKVEVDFYVVDSITQKGIEETRIALSYEDIGHEFFTNEDGKAKSILNPLKDYTASFEKKDYEAKTISVSVEDIIMNTIKVTMFPDYLNDSTLLALSDEERLAALNKLAEEQATANNDESGAGDRQGVGADGHQTGDENALALADETDGNDLDGMALGGAEGEPTYDRYVQLIMLNSDEGWLTYAKSEQGFYQLQEDGSEFSLKNSKDQVALKSIKKWLNPVHKATRILNSSGYGITSTMVIDNALYDYNMALIRNNSSAQLDRIAEVLIENPGLGITLNSHADSRGGQAYNLKLSERRGIAAKDYLVESGIDSARINLTNFGEGKLLNNCGDGKKCSEQDHELNRRTTFTLQMK